MTRTFVLGVDQKTLELWDLVLTLKSRILELEGEKKVTANGG